MFKVKKLRFVVFFLLFTAVIAAAFSPTVQKFLDRRQGRNPLENGAGAETPPQEREGYVWDEAAEAAEEQDYPPFPSQVNITKPRPTSGREPVILPTTIEGGMVISNDTGFELDLNDLAAAGTSIRLSGTGYQILIVHTHGSEAYAADWAYGYETSDNCRTEDRRYNVVRVGDEIAACLESYGFRVLHDREIYDYPSYTGSYSRSGAAVERYLSEHPEISIVLDVHRDAIGTGDIVYKTVAEAGGIPASQVMLLCGTGENGLYHPNWKENLKLALYLQSAVVRKYPTLARPIALKKERYNQQLSLGALIVEVGSSGNTLSEALQAARLFAAAIAPSLEEIVLD